MFYPGDLIVYGRTGVCRVEGIEREGEQEYYVLSPLYQTCSILTPVNGKVLMRPIMTRDEAYALIDRIPTVEAKPVEGLAARELTDRYQSALTACSAEHLLRLTMSIYAKRQSAQQAKRKFGAVDERFMKEGEALLFGELAVALEVPVEEVQDCIRQRLESKGPLTG